MHAHKIKLNIATDHRVSFELPDDFPAGEAEIIVLAPAKRPAPVPSAPRTEPAQPAAAEFSGWLGALLDCLPAAPALPALAFDRASIYED